MNRKVNILFVIPSLDTGGAELQTINQLNILYLNKKYKIHIVVLSGRASNLKLLKLPSSQCTLCLENDITFLSSSVFKKLPYLIRCLNRVVVNNNVSHIIAILPLAHVICRVAKLYGYFLRQKGFNLIVYHHSMQYEASPMDNSIKILFNFFNNFFSKLSDNKNIFISKAVKNNISKNIYVRSPKVIPNAIPYIKPDSLHQPTILLNKDISRSYKILVPGRINSIKGHYFFLDNIAAFIQKNNLKPNDIKIIIGGGGEQTRLENAIYDKNLKDYFIVTGFLANEKLLSYMKFSDLVVIPSIHEGFGNVAIEAMMVGSLILSSDAGGLKEIIRNNENGFLFKKNDVADFLNKISFLYFNRETILIDPKELQKEYHEKYDLSNQVDQLIEFVLED